MCGGGGGGRGDNQCQTLKKGKGKSPRRGKLSADQHICVLINMKHSIAQSLTGLFSSDEQDNSSYC